MTARIAQLVAGTYVSRAGGVGRLRYGPRHGAPVGLCAGVDDRAEPNPDLQVDELPAAGCLKVWTDRASGL